MRFEVEHTTRFRYTEPVHLEQMTVRLRPRADRSQRPLHFELELDPRPAGRTELTDIEGNDSDLVWYRGPVDELLIRAKLKADTLRSNPFDYMILDPDHSRLPMHYPEEGSRALDRYLRGEVDPRVAVIAQDLCRAAESDAQRFLTELNIWINEEIEGEVRHRGDARSSRQTLERAQGSCRDMSVLFMDACRSVGLAARFVSGYQEGDPDTDEKYLHAWPEVYLSQVGWRGYDPTLGLVVADSHLSLAAGPSPESVAPTSGTYRGSASSKMEFELDIRVGPSPDEA